MSMRWVLPARSSSACGSPSKSQSIALRLIQSKSSFLSTPGEPINYALTLLFKKLHPSKLFVGKLPKSS